MTLNETVLTWREKLLKRNHRIPSVAERPYEEGGMRTVIFGAILLAIASAVFHNLISTSLVAAQEAKAATFSERFAPCLKSTAG